MSSSSFETLRLLVHPVECHGTLHVSGRSREGSFVLPRWWYQSQSGFGKRIYTSRRSKTSSGDVGNGPEFPQYQR